jgi:hypothetical protein
MLVLPRKRNQSLIAQHDELLSQSEKIRTVFAAREPCFRAVFATSAEDISAALPEPPDSNDFTRQYLFG